MTLPFAAGAELPRTAFEKLRLRAIFECCKWDPQVGDTPVLAPFPILLARDTWAILAESAEALARETLAAEDEILLRPELLKNLGLPRAIWKLLAGSGGAERAPRHPRALRFDFHFTAEGWRISEVNSDVPGGFVEAGGFTRLMAEACGAESTGDPAARLAEALARAAGAGKKTIALVHASAYSDDRQVAECLSGEIAKLGAHPVLVDPSQVRWQDDRAFVRTAWFEGEAHAIYRFFPAEWLPNLRRSSPWQHYFTGQSVPQCNPGVALASQSKRFGVLLPRLQTPVPVWRALLPETREVRGLRINDPQWVFKPALGRVGEAIQMHGVTPAKETRQIRRSLFFFPGAWVAQRRFESVPLPTPLGPQHVCLGVYSVDGRAAGIYGRCSPRPIIDHAAREAAILLKD